MAGHGMGVNSILHTRPLRVARVSGTRQIQSRLLRTNWSARSLGPEGLVPNFLVPWCGLPGPAAGPTSGETQLSDIAFPNIA